MGNKCEQLTELERIKKRGNRLNQPLVTLCGRPDIKSKYLFQNNVTFWFCTSEKVSDKPVTVKKGNKITNANLKSSNKCGL